MVLWKMYSLLICISFNGHKSCPEEKVCGHGGAVNKGTEAVATQRAFPSPGPKEGTEESGYHTLAEPRIHPDRSLDRGLPLSLSWHHGSRHEIRCHHSPSALASIPLKFEWRSVQLYPANQELLSCSARVPI